VFGARSAVAMREPPRAAAMNADSIVARGSWVTVRDDHHTRGSASQQRGAGLHPSPLNADAVRDLMWRSAGLFRTRDDLQSAVTALDRAQAFEPGLEGWRLRNLVTVAGLIARAAVRREESRGGHFRADFPKRDDRSWRVHIVDEIGRRQERV